MCAFVFIAVYIGASSVIPQPVKAPIEPYYPPAAPTIQVPKPRKLGVTKFGYSFLEEGMTRLEVADILGEWGEETASMGATTVCTWETIDRHGKYGILSVTFRDDRLVSKLQAGLPEMDY